MFYKNAPANTGEGTFFNPSKASRDSATNFAKMFAAGMGSYGQGSYTPKQQGAPTQSPLTVGSNKGRSVTVGDGSLQVLYPDSFDPIVLPGGPAAPQGKSTGQRLAGAGMGALQGFSAFGPIGAVAGGLGGLLG